MYVAIKHLKSGWEVSLMRKSFSELYVSFCHTELVKNYNLVISPFEFNILATGIILGKVEVEKLFLDKSISNFKDPFVMALVVSLRKMGIMGEILFDQNLTNNSEGL
eukprot:NODE_11_length_54881_cov_1.430718.p43 type:complete len:107 gc:universal NODE_11_length_54881_cov_1.430718:40167-39847(-)